MKKYEVLYIISTKVPEADREGIFKKYEDIIVSHGGSVESIDKWGMKKFMYPINFQNEGFYVLMTFESGNEGLAEMERKMRLSDRIVRYMVTLAYEKPVKVAKAEPAKVEEVAPVEAKPEEAAVVTEETDEAENA